MFGSIRSRLLALVFATVVPFTALVGVNFWSTWEDDDRDAKERVDFQAQLIGARLDDHVSTLEAMLLGLSRAVSTDPDHALANDTLLRQLKRELPDYINNIQLFAPDGINIGSSFEVNPRRLNGRDRPYFAPILGGEKLVIGNPFRARSTGEWIVSVATSVRDNVGRLTAVLAIGTKPDHLQNLLGVSRLPPGSVVQIVNERGILLAEFGMGPAPIGRDLREVSHVRDHLDGDAAARIVRWTDNITRITGSATASKVPWLVFVGLPSDFAFASLTTNLRWGALLGLFTLLVVVLISWSISGHIVRPLKQLTRDAAELAAGNLGHRSDVRTQDEVGTLANTLNSMAESLEGRHRELSVAREAATIEAKERARVQEMERQAKETLAAVVDASPVAIVCSSPDRQIMVWSRAAERMFGYTAEEAVGRLTRLVPPDRMAESQALFDRAIGGELLRNVQVKRLRKDGSLLDVSVAAAAMYHADGTVRGVAWSYEDITDRKKAAEQLERLAHYDQLTGLPNRLMMQNELAKALTANRRGKPTAIALFDLDGFKDVNDTLGHSTGDRLLKEVGRRLASVATGKGQVCRLGGDEFIVIMPDYGDPRLVGEIVESMLQQLADPFEVNDQVLHLGGSAGIAIAPTDGASADELIANADLALYQAKSEGRRTYRFFLPVLRAQAQARRGLDHELRRAFADNEFELHYQPQVRLADGEVVGAEALLRWRHPARGILAPGAFIDALAESPIAPDVGRWILRTACARAAQWRAEGLPLGRIGVNLFPIQFRAEALVDDVGDALRQTGLPADALEVEITENIALIFENANVPLRKLRQMGVKLAFDDFGTGYASLIYLTRFPLSRIKIDHGFVKGIAAGTQDAALVSSLIFMAHNLGLEVTAEGVETAEQAAFLLNAGCEEAQGFLFSKPLSAGEFERYLKSRLDDSACAEEEVA